MKGNLVDRDGFPRADIDVVNVREQRSRFARLKTDHKSLSSRLEQLLLIALPPTPEQLNSLAHPSNPSNHTEPSVPIQPTPTTHLLPQPTSQQQKSSSAALDLRQPFALIDIVSPTSPASDAGLIVEDKIIAVGAVSLRSSPTPTQAMSLLPGLLREHENRPVDIVVKRSVASTMLVKVLKLTPRRWEGQGLLGCHIVPLEVSEVDPTYAPEVATAVANKAYALN